MSFDDYLDMYSALSEQATRDVKTAYAFRIYDFDGDGVIGMKYLKKNFKKAVTSQFVISHEPTTNHPRLIYYRA